MTVSEKKSATKLLAVPDVADICGVATETIRRLTDRGAMPMPVRLGRSVRYRLDDIESWIGDGCPDLSIGRRR